MQGITLHTRMIERKAMGKGLFLANNTCIRTMSKSKVFYGKIDSFEFCENYTHFASNINIYL